MRQRDVLVVSDLAQRLPERILRLTLVVRPMQYDRTLCNCRFHGCPRPRETLNKMRRSYWVVAYEPEPLDKPADGNLLVCCSQPIRDVVIDL